MNGGSLLRRASDRLGRRLGLAVSGTRLAWLRRPLLRLRRGNVVMFHVGRSGSSVLADLLNQHSDIYWDGELFSGCYGETEGQMRQRGFNTRSRWNSSTFFPHDPVGFVHSRMPLAGFKAYYGFETKFYHLTCNNLALPDFVACLGELGFTHFIVLERRNLLRKIVSSVIARANRRYHRSEQQEAVLTQVHLDPDKIEIDSNSRPLLDYLREWESCFAELERLLEQRTKLWLTYEQDILADPLNGYRRCCGLLGVRPCQATVRYGRTNPFPVRQAITNWRQIAQVLSGTAYEWMLYD